MWACIDISGPVGADHALAFDLVIGAARALERQLFQAYLADIENKSRSMVGAIVPFIDYLLQFGPAELVVADHKHETLVEARGCTTIADECVSEALAACDTAILTGATIPNGTLPGLLEAVAADAVVSVIGPTAGILPEPLFDRGVSVVGTTLVTDVDQALDILSEGGGMT